MQARFHMVTTHGLGFMRPFPGTWGSLPPVALAGLMLALGAPRPLSDGLLLVVLLVYSLACVMYGDHAEARFGRKDPSQVVADETAGQCIPLLLLPAASISTPIRAGATLLGAFVLFRLCDIIKPPPAYQIQRLPGGWGILLDDLIAGVQAMIVLQVILRLVL